MTNVQLLCHSQCMTKLHDKLRWCITNWIMNCEFIICRLISHSDIICQVILSCTENDKLIEHSSFINSSCNF